jgi:hypothetical protein
MIEVALGGEPRPIVGRDTSKEEESMRLIVLACGLGVLALAGATFSSDPAAAAKTKMGCERGKQVWNATAGKCEARKAGKPAKKAAKAAKSAPAKKK